ncbi:MAG: TIR domain-containing protein [Chloroflexi bacterium]|nr:TIR domain-containing protein [Chloroflexota bacterium]
MPSLDNAHALIVGIANYQRINPLPPTVLKDAQDIYNLLVRPDQGGYVSNNVQLLLDEHATLAALRQQLSDLAQRSNADSTVLIYISSHGGSAETRDGLRTYLLPVDADLSSNSTLDQTALSGGEFTNALRRIPARKVLVIFDCCHAGGLGQPKDARARVIKSGLPASYYDQLKMGRGRVILASSRSDESSFIQPGAGNSVFTEHLLAGLRGGAPAPGGIVWVLDLFKYVQPRVTAAQPNQHPILKAEIEQDLPVALSLGGKGAAAPLQPAALPPRANPFTYDVFVSYFDQDPDKTWVRKTLLPRLVAAGLKVCIDYLCFRLGAAKVEEMARAVEQSHYTLAVLTPNYLNSGFDEFENILAETLGREKKQRRLLSLLREDCQPNLRMRARVWLDLTDDEQFEMNMERLLYELHQPAAAD